MTNLETHLTIMSIGNRTAMVRRANGQDELWSLASLPTGLQMGDLVAVRVVHGALEAWIEQVKGEEA